MSQVVKNKTGQPVQGLCSIQSCLLFSSGWGNPETGGLETETPKAMSSGHLPWGPHALLCGSGPLILTQSIEEMCLLCLFRATISAQLWERRRKESRFKVSGGTSLL